jgi:hypothetical protein
LPAGVAPTILWHSFNSWEGGINPKEIEMHAEAGPPGYMGPYPISSGEPLLAYAEMHAEAGDRREIGGRESPLLSLLVLGMQRPSIWGGPYTIDRGVGGGGYSI